MFAATLTILASDVRGQATPNNPETTDSELSAQDPTLRRGEAYFRLMQAQQALRDGRVLDVLRQLREAIALEPESAELHAQAAGLLVQLGQRSEGERLAQRALEIDPEHRGALLVLADLWASRAAGPEGDEHSRREAIRLYEKLAEDPGADDEILLILAQLKLRDGDNAGAIAAASKLVAQRPGDPLPVRLLAQALTVDGRVLEAQEALLDFVVSNASAEDLLFMAEHLAQRTGEWESIEKTCTRIIEAQPTDAGPVHGVRGRARLSLDDPHGAVSDLELAIAMDPDDPSIAVDLARAYQLANRLADAAALAGSVVRESPGSVRPLWILAEVREGQGDVEGALSAYAETLVTLTQAPTTSPEQRDRPRLRMAGLLAGSGRATEALAMLDELEAPSDPDAVRIAAQVAVEAGDLKRARSLIRKGHATGADVALIDAQLLLAEGDVDKAMAQLSVAIAETGASGRRWAAKLLQDHGYVEQEATILREWSAQEPDNPVARFSLGSYLDRVGRYEEAEAEFRRALELRPGFSEVMNYLGYSLADRDVRLPEALDLALAALEIDPWNGAYLDTLGWVYYRMGRYEEARAPLERAARELPNDPTVLEHLGDLYERLKEPESAIAAWRQALDSGSGNQEALRRKLSDAEGSPPSEESRARNGPGDTSGATPR